MHHNSLPLVLVVAGLALIVGALPAPADTPPEFSRGAAIVVLTIGLWATGALAEHVASLAFFLLAMVLAVAPAEVVFGGFASSALWLVFGGLVIGVAAERTGLGRWLAGGVVGILSGSYPRAVAGVVVGSSALGFLMPSAMGRAMILMPIATGLADRIGFERGHPGRTGIVLAAALSSYLVPAAVLPANLPNVMLLGAASTLHGITLTYGEYLLLHFPVSGLLKGVLLVALILRLFPAELPPGARTGERGAPLTREGRRLLVLLCVALALWMTDSVHGIRPGWVAMAVGLACLVPGSGLVPAESFRSDVSFATVLYTAAVLGVGAVVARAGVGDAFAGLVLDRLDLDPGAPFRGYMTLSLLAFALGLFATMPGIVAILTPLAPDAAAATGLPLLTVLMTTVNGYSTIAFPYQTAPMLVAVKLGGARMLDAVKVTLPLTAITLVGLLPVNFLWWKLLGYVG